MKSRDRLKFRVYAAVRGVVLGTELFRSHSELYEPDIAVNVYPSLIDVTTSLTEGQVRLLPVRGRLRELSHFAEELRKGLEAAAPGLQLEFTTDPARLGGSQPLMLVDVPSGYRAVLIRREPE
jgi:hypothetical protein